MSLERVRCTLFDFRSDENISTSLAIHQSLITNIRIWCTRHPGKMELFMSREQIEDVQKDNLPDYDFEPVFISPDGRQTLLSSHDKISTYLKSLDIPYSLDNGLVLYVRIVRSSSGRRRVFFSPVREAVAKTAVNRKLTRPVSDGQGGMVWPGGQKEAPPEKESREPVDWKAFYTGALAAVEKFKKLAEKNRRAFRRAAIPAAIVIFYFFFCLVARPGLMHTLYASGQYGAEVFLYNMTSPWCLPGQKEISRLAEQQIDALYIQATPYEKNASRSLIKLTAFKSISDSRLSGKAALYTDQLTFCLKDLDICAGAKALYEEGRYVDAIIFLRQILGDSLVISAAEDIRYDCYDKLTEDISSPETKEDCEKALTTLDRYLSSLVEDQTLQWTREETARKYESLILEEAEDLAEAGSYDQAEALLARALTFCDSDTLRSIHEGFSGRQEEDLIIASSWTAFRAGSAAQAREIIRQGLTQHPESQRLMAVENCYASYKEISFRDLPHHVQENMLRDHFNMPDGSRLDNCLVFSKFTESTPPETVTATADPGGIYQTLEGTIYAGKYLDADGRLEIYGDDILLYDSGRIYRPESGKKDTGTHFSISTAGIKQITVRAYVYSQPTAISVSGVTGAPDRESLCTLVVNDLIFHDDLTEEMIWDAAGQLEE